MDKIKIENAVKDILEAIGEDPEREGLKETPTRVANMYEEIFSGLEDNAEDYLKVFNEEHCGEIVIVKDIPFYSMCEHHLLPFFGKIDIAYIPNDNKVIGLSKLARIVNVFARRPQIQERLTSDIVDFLDANLNAKGICVCVSAEHLCMTMRGIKAMGTTTQTVKFSGVLNDNQSKRAEVLNLLKGE